MKFPEKNEPYKCQAEYARKRHAESGVLVFPNQTISSEDLKRFGRYFGELTVHPFSTSTKDAPELIVYDNKEGNPPPATDIWHTDETFRAEPPMVNNGLICHSANSQNAI